MMRFGRVLAAAAFLLLGPLASVAGAALSRGDALVTEREKEEVSWTDDQARTIQAGRVPRLPRNPSKIHNGSNLERPSDDSEERNEYEIGRPPVFSTLNICRLKGEFICLRNQNSGIPKIIERWRKMPIEKFGRKDREMETPAD